MVSFPFSCSVTSPLYVCVCYVYECFACMYVCMCVLCVMVPSQERVSESMEVELWTVLNPIWVLGTEPGSSSSALNHWAITSALPDTFNQFFGHEYYNLFHFFGSSFKHLSVVTVVFLGKIVYMFNSMGKVLLFSSCILLYSLFVWNFEIFLIYIKS